MSVCFLLLKENTRGWVIYKERVQFVRECANQEVHEHGTVSALLISGEGFGLCQLLADEGQVRVDGRHKAQTVSEGPSQNYARSPRARTHLGDTHPLIRVS